MTVCGRRFLLTYSDHIAICKGEYHSYISANYLTSLLLLLLVVVLMNSILFMLSGEQQLSLFDFLTCHCYVDCISITCCAVV
jgi:hypothetical protein